MTTSRSLTKQVLQQVHSHSQMYNCRRGDLPSIMRKVPLGSDGECKKPLSFSRSRENPIYWLCSRLGLEQAGRVLIFQLLAQFDQLLLECQEPVTDGVRQVAVVHGGVG